MKRKNLAAKKIARKKLAKTKDKKILIFYKKFEKKIYKSLNKEKFAIAVSGGSDSMCLAFFAARYALSHNNKIYTLIIDHKLRKDSSLEAKKVKRILTKNNIKSNILTWKGKIPKSNIQLNARNIRYSLLSEYCYKKKIKNLIVAHHVDDQIENFFIRLIRGSGLSGLASMSEISNFNDNLKIIRPFLDFTKDDLKHVTKSVFKNFISDPSNENQKFLRVRVRNYRKDLEKEGLDTKKIIKTVNNLLSANKALNFYKKKALHKHAYFLSKSKCLVNSNIFLDEPQEIIFKCFSNILSLVSNAYYPPRSKKVVNLIERIEKNNYHKSTLGGCIIEKKDGFILFVKEKNKQNLI